MALRALLVVCVCASRARAELPPDLLAKQGYKAGASIFESATARVATAKKAGKPRVVLVTAKDQIVDGGKPEPGVLTAKDSDVAAAGAGTTTGGSSARPGPASRARRPPRLMWTSDRVLVIQIER